MTTRVKIINEGPHNVVIETTTGTRMILFPNHEHEEYVYDLSKILVTEETNE